MKKNVVIITIVIVVLLFVRYMMTPNDNVSLIEESNTGLNNTIIQDKIDDLCSDWEHTWNEITEFEGELSEFQIEQINNLLVPVFSTEDFFEVNPLSCFFTSYYAESDEINMDDFLRYFPYDEAPEEIEEFEELKTHKNWPFIEVTNLNELPVPVHRYEGEVIRMFVLNFMNLDEFKFYDLNEAIYLESTDCYYNYTSDFGPGTFICTTGNVKGNTITLNGESSVLVIVNNGEKYLIESYTTK